MVFLVNKLACYGRESQLLTHTMSWIAPALGFVRLCFLCLFAAWMVINFSAIAVFSVAFVVCVCANEKWQSIKWLNMNTKRLPHGIFQSFWNHGRVGLVCIGCVNSSKIEFDLKKKKKSLNWKRQRETHIINGYFSKHHIALLWADFNAILVVVIFVVFVFLTGSHSEWRMWIEMENTNNMLMCKKFF